MPPSTRSRLRVKSEFALGQELDPSSLAMQSRRHFPNKETGGVTMPLRDTDRTENKKIKERQKSPKTSSSKSSYNKQHKSASGKMLRDSSTTSKGTRKTKQREISFNSHPRGRKEQSETPKSLPKKDNRKSDPYPRQSSSSSRSDFSKNVQTVTDQRIVEQKRRNYESEKGRRQQQQADAISNRLERKRDLSEKTKEAVLKAMMNSKASSTKPDLPELPKSFIYNLNNKSGLSTRHSKMYEKVVPFTATPGFTVSAPTDVPQGPPPLSSKKGSGVSVHKKTAWFQKAMTTFGKQTAHEASGIPKPFHETSFAQQQRWLNEVHTSINEAQVAKFMDAKKPVRTSSELLALKEFGLSPHTPEHKKSTAESEVADEYTVREPPRIIDRSHSAEDDESVSSMVLLFNWLSCNPVPDQNMQINHRGKLVLVESFDSSNSILSEKSNNANQQHRYKLVCSR